MSLRRTMRGALLLAGLAGCTVGPDFVRPDAPALAGYPVANPADPAVSLTTDPDPRWWQGFRDPVLTELMDTAIRNNLNVQQAILKVISARQSIVTARAAGLPSLSGKGSYMREQLGAKGILESKGAYKDLNELANQAQNYGALGSAGVTSGEVSAVGLNALNGITQPINLFQDGLSASWELDLFGRVRRSVEQATAQAESMQEQANDSLVSLESQVAQSYVQLRGAQRMLAIQQQNVRSAQTSFDLTVRRQRQGLASGSDVEQSRTQLLGQQAQLPNYEKQAQQAIDQLNNLVGAVPGTLDAKLAAAAPLPTIPAVVGVGLPSTLARRRPDIRSAEAQLHAAVAGVGVAVAMFYPDVSLTGSLGLRATDASYLTNWASHYYSAGPSISVPIFQGGQLTANLTMNRAQAVTAALNYRGTVLNALREVEDGLVAYRSDRQQREDQARTVASGELALTLARERYDHGLGDFLSVLSAEQTADNARQQLVQADVALANDIVTLYRALGGGWEDPGASSQVPPVSGRPPITPAALDAVAGSPP